MGNPRMVLRWEIPVDDQWHRIPFVGSIVHIDARRFDRVEIWTTADVYVSHSTNGSGRILKEDIATSANLKVNDREFRVFDTGQPVEGLYHGTAVIGTVVWHLYSRFAEIKDE